MAISMQPAQAGFAVVAAISNRRTRHPALIGVPFFGGEGSRGHCPRLPSREVYFQGSYHEPAAHHSG